MPALPLPKHAAPTYQHHWRKDLGRLLLCCGKSLGEQNKVASRGGGHCQGFPVWQRSFVALAPLAAECRCWPRAGLGPHSGQADSGKGTAFVG
eukprot:15462483-Alexandrium_andersonii.AAC.1